MIHAVSFENSEVKYMNRWVRTNKFLLERQARRSLFAGGRDFGKSDPSVKDIPGFTANTSVIWHANKLLALNEGSLPYALAPSTLKTEGVWTYQNTLTRTMTAHPKIDQRTGDMHCICISYINPPETAAIYYFTINAQGKITQ